MNSDQSGILSRLFRGFISKPKVSSAGIDQQQKELEKFYLGCKKEFQQSRLALIKSYDFASLIVRTAIEYAQEKQFSEQKLPSAIVEALLDVALGLIEQDKLFDFPSVDFSRTIPLSRQIDIKNQIQQAQLRAYDGSETLLCFYSSLSYSLEHFILSLGDTTPFNDEKQRFYTAIVNTSSGIPKHVEQMCVAFFSEDIASYGLFENIRSRLLENADVVSGFGEGRNWKERDIKPAKLPTEVQLKPEDIPKAYLRGTPLLSLFQLNTGFSIPIDLRIEHCHIMAGTGHGKTQLIQELILEDLNQGRGFMVIDSQGDMISKISRLSVFNPNKPDSLAEKLIIIDPEDINYPVALNMFALDSGKELSSGLQKSMLINSATELYQYIFGALFGAELTSKQGVLFRYIARLMAEIPDASIHTLREVLEDARRFQEYIDELDGSARVFFETQYFTKSFSQTKKQILSRLWAILSNQTMENIFSSKSNAVDLNSAINEGKIVLVNTSKSLLQSQGSQILGRFFIALLSQAVIKRVSIPENERKPYMVYVDEAQEYFDEKLEEMLNQARKFKVGFTLSHQNLGQLGSLKYTVLSSTSVKLAGGISSRDALEIYYEMKSSRDELLSAKKTKSTTTFYCYLKNVTESAIPLSFKLGGLESLPTMPNDSFQKLTNLNRSRYCNQLKDIQFTGSNQKVDQFQSDYQEEHSRPLESKFDEKSKGKLAAVKTTVPAQTKGKSKVRAKVIDVPPEGKGGLSHRYLQNLVKKMAQEKGFHSVIESSVLEGLGSVDVALEGHFKKIAIEVSVSTGSQWEIGNITKCFSAGFDYVVIISSDKKHLVGVENLALVEFPQQIKDNRLLFMMPPDLARFLERIRCESSENKTTVAGYQVKVKYRPSDSFERELREEALVNILAGMK